ncbi:hypothetical protein WA026_000357 [Henosepilachna vigintioctopunctata]|uniref:Chemosensory protein n=1 Tax=Henosepilachna vigintioctopunctata TaxID=420089 RepID=A0AAW1V4W8_9CUCU
MNFLVVFVVVAISVACVNCEDLYTSKFDNIDIDAIMKNDRLLQNHFACIIDGKGCTAEADELRKHIPEIMETCCSKCTDKQKEGAKKMTTYLIENKPDIVKKLVDKFDPDRKYIEKCKEQLKSGGVDTSKLQ